MESGVTRVTWNKACLKEWEHQLNVRRDQAAWPRGVKRMTHFSTRVPVFLARSPRIQPWLSPSRWYYFLFSLFIKCEPVVVRERTRTLLSRELITVGEFFTPSIRLLSNLNEQAVNFSLSNTRWEGREIWWWSRVRNGLHCEAFKGLQGNIIIIH